MKKMLENSGKRPNIFFEELTDSVEFTGCLDWSFQGSQRHYKMLRLILNSTTHHEFIFGSVNGLWNIDNHMLFGVPHAQGRTYGEHDYDSEDYCVYGERGWK